MRGALAAGLIAALLSAPARARQAAVLVESSDQRGAAIQRRLAEELQGVTVDELRLDASRLGNPIYKGQVVASLAGAPLIVAVGDAAAGFALTEVEDTPVYFAGASLLEGRFLAEGRASGTLGYSVDDVLDAAPAAWRAGLGVLYTHGYEPVLEIIKTAAAHRGIKIIGSKIERRRDLAPAARALMDEARAVWALGDPTVVRGAAFEFLVEESLARGVPLVGAGRWEVERGALLCSEGSAEGVARRSAQGVRGILSGGPAGRMSTAPAGSIYFNSRAAARFAVRPKAGASWRAVP